MGGMSESKANKFSSAKQISYIKSSNYKDTWLFRMVTESDEITDIFIKFGEDKHELTPFQIPVKAIYIRDSKHKVTAHYVLYDGRHCKVIREA